MFIKELIRKTPFALLGLGVAAGVGGGVIFGGYKLREALVIRNKSMDFGKDQETESDKISPECPLSDNFERLFEKKDTVSDATQKSTDSGGSLGARAVW